MIDQHTGQVIPRPEHRDYAYQSETSYPGTSIKSYPSRRDQSTEAELYSDYELTIYKGTDTSLVVTLTKKRRDIVQQRMVHGAAVIEEKYQATMDFAELCNRILAPGCHVYLEEERFPDEIKQAMKDAYKG